ncbi:Glycosyltransferase involved in cell wall bisynthesis [Abditibacterium utsteinense]|uniref:Glycosyltransferase involved in cell wall bisynthesis n=1 Tax=Abditibacterium utsteinense TaxID=1960156 RepID=A0A2S8SSE0_9BACT|nr:glycosyltransferase family 4 protein [Abditibacterium utsteinense]PQV63696.1 Glycosyltransferase involved in cell wall bisynthesis [Abditibacterium utsteinense]
MHFCYILPPIEPYSPRIGGAIATCTLNQARCVLAQGHRVSVLTPQERELYSVGEVIPIAGFQREELSLVQRFFSSKIRRRLYHWHWLYYEYFRAAFTHAIQKMTTAPDVIVVHNDFITAIDVAERFPRSQVVLWLHNEITAPQSTVQKAAQKAHFFCVSSHIARWTTETYALPPQTATVALNGVDSQVFHPTANFDVPRSPDEALRVLYLGRLDPNKGPDLAIEAVRRLQSEGLRVEITVVGNVWFKNDGSENTDPYALELQAALKTVGARLLGHMERGKVPAVVREHDVLCMPSRFPEPFGLVLLEGMASGCAVIATRRGGIPDCAGENEEAGAILVEPDAGEFAHHLRDFAQSPDLLMSWKRRAVKRAALLSWERNAQICLELVQGAA